MEIYLYYSIILIMEKTIKVNDKNITIKRFDEESDDVYDYRLNYINNNINPDNIKKILNNSKILANIKFKMCRYEPKIYNTLKKFI